MTRVYATDSAAGFDMYDTGFVRWSGLAPLTFAEVFAYDAGDTGESTYAPQRINIYGNHDFSYDAVDNPAGGNADTVNINIDDDALDDGIDVTNDIAITAAPGTFWPLTFVAPNGTNEYIAADTFWSTLLAGDDTLLAPTAGAAFLTGDFHTVGNERFAGNDTFSVVAAYLTGARSTYDDAMVGDAFRVMEGGVLHGGADGFTVGGLSTYAIYGDAWSNFFGATVIGGDDTIIVETTGQRLNEEEYNHARMVGDVRYNDGFVEGGNDTIKGSGNATINDRLVGDVRVAFASLDHRSLTEGGNDHISGRAGLDTIAGDVESSQGGDIHGGRDTLSGGGDADLVVGDLIEQDYGHFGEGTALVGGNDLLKGDGGNDTLVGDVDTVTFLSEEDSIKGGKDTLRGGAGNDVLYGDVREVLLVGDAVATIKGGADSLDGGAGRDTMLGGRGNDRYVFDDVGDQADETGGGGIDTIISSVSVEFSASSVVGAIENLILVGSAISGIGDGLNNTLRGNGAANILMGKGGDDVVRGGGGKDNLDGGSGRDTADYSDKGAAVSVALHGSRLVTVKVGGKAEDSIGDIENLIGGSKSDRLEGDGKANRLAGGKGGDTLVGGDGADTLLGGKGADQLRGNDGKDQFVFSAALSAGNVDLIKDFKHDIDLIVLDDAIFAAAGGKLGKGEFYAKAGAHAAHDGNDHIIYNKSNGKLFYDDDGKGGHAAVLFATLDGHPRLEAGDFAIV